MTVDFPDPLSPTRAVAFPASILRLRPWKIICPGLDGYEKIAKTDLTAPLPFDKSDVIVPASAMVRPVLIRMKKVIKSCFELSSSLAMRVPPYQNVKAAAAIVRN